MFLCRAHVRCTQGYGCINLPYHIASLMVASILINDVEGT